MGRLPLFFCLLHLMAWRAHAGEGILTLQDCYQPALKKSETLLIRDESLRVAEAHYLQALSTALPHLNLKATETIQDTSSSAGDGVVNTFVRRSRPEVAVGIRQPLFQGFREFRALGVADSEKKKYSLERERAKQLLFTDVARAYMAVLEVEGELKILDGMKETLQKRIAELEERIRLGKSRRSEVLTAESQIAALEAEIGKTEGAIQTTRDWLGFLTGREVVERLADDIQVPETPLPLEAHLASLNQRPDLAAQSEAVRLARGKLSYEKGGRLPTIDLESHYYPYRVGFFSDVRWDINLSLNLPLFKGGATRGKIREADALWRQSDLAKQEANRHAELEIRQAYHDLVSSLSREAALRRAQSKSEANYHSQLAEYRLGLVNNLEVLQALRDWQERRREANRAHYETKRTAFQLRLATGDLQN